MDFQLYITFVGACIILGLIPGPNVALIVASSLRYGTRYGLFSLLGSTSAMVPQLAVVALGLSAVLTIMSEWFEVIRWAGVAYLLYLGVRQFNLKPELLDLNAGIQKRRILKTYWIGFLVSATNPKTLLFFGAFLPQFVSTEYAVLPQMCILSITLIACVSLVDVGWAVLAGYARPVLTKVAHLRNRLSGLLFITSGLGLALAKKSS